MYLDKDKILEALAGYDHKSLLVFLREALDEMEPEQIDAVFGEMMYTEVIRVWLDRCCELADAGYVEVAVHGLASCLELIDRMNEGEEIVFASECGDGMITSRFDYEAVFYRIREMV